MTKPRNIRNPHKWVGRYVRHMANWRTYEYHPEFFVCEWSGKLYRHEEDVMNNITLDAQSQAEALGLDPCYTYAWQAVQQYAPQIWARLN